MLRLFLPSPIRLPASLSAFALLAGCATTPVETVKLPAPPKVAGMEQIIGKPAETALGLLGTPRLDRKEGVARQLQFSGGCVLDIFYYAEQPGAAPVATHVDSRLVDGRDFAPRECLVMLMNARKSGQPASR